MNKLSLPDFIQNLVDSFTKLPGIGPKSALRYVLDMSTWPQGEIRRFAENLNGLLSLKRCEECGLFCDKMLCEICLEEHRAEGPICVVEGISECLAIERSGQYAGLYHLLGGVLNPLMGVGPEDLSCQKLVERVKKLDIDEVILALGPSVEGDATCAYLRQILPDHINVCRIGFGVPIGSNLEYLDAMTISKALENRKSLA